MPRGSDKLGDDECLRIGIETVQSIPGVGEDEAAEAADRDEAIDGDAFSGDKADHGGKLAKLPDTWEKD